MYSFKLHSFGHAHQIVRDIKYKIRNQSLQFPNSLWQFPTIILYNIIIEFLKVSSEKCLGAPPTGTGMMGEVLKQTGTQHVSSEVLKMSVSTGDSATFCFTWLVSKFTHFGYVSPFTLACTQH